MRKSLGETCFYRSSRTNKVGMSTWACMGFKLPRGSWLKMHPSKHSLMILYLLFYSHNSVLCIWWMYHIGHYWSENSGLVLIRLHYPVLKSACSPMQERQPRMHLAFMSQPQISQYTCCCIHCYFQTRLLVFECASGIIKLIHVQDSLKSNTRVWTNNASSFHVTTPTFQLHRCFSFN